MTNEWSKEKPAHTGFYWYKDATRQPADAQPYVTIVEVVICEDSFVAELGKEGDEDLERFSGEWMGPLDVPQ